MCPSALFQQNPSLGLVFHSAAHSFDVRASVPFFDALQHTKRVSLRPWSGTKRLVVLAVGLCSDVMKLWPTNQWWKTPCVLPPGMNSQPPLCWRRRRRGNPTLTLEIRIVQGEKKINTAVLSCLCRNTAAPFPDRQGAALWTPRDESWRKNVWVCRSASDTS